VFFRKREETRSVLSDRRHHAKDAPILSKTRSIHHMKGCITHQQKSIAYFQTPENLYAKFSLEPILVFPLIFQIM
jgi:hypothetical protein